MSGTFESRSAPELLVVKSLVCVAGGTSVGMSEEFVVYSRSESTREVPSLYLAVTVTLEITSEYEYNTPPFCVASKEMICTSSKSASSEPFNLFPFSSYSTETVIVRLPAVNDFWLIRYE